LQATTDQLEEEVSVGVTPAAAVAGAEDGIAVLEVEPQDVHGAEYVSLRCHSRHPRLKLL
jgi:hypothetical protein